MLRISQNMNNTKCYFYNGLLAGFFLEIEHYCNCCSLNVRFGKKKLTALTYIYLFVILTCTMTFLRN